MKNSFYDIDIIQLGKYLGISANDKMSEDFIISDIRYNRGLDMLKYPCRFNGYMGIFCLKGNLEAEINLKRYNIKENSLIISTPGNISRVYKADEKESIHFIAVAASSEFMTNIRYDLARLFNESMSVLNNPCISLNDDECEIYKGYFSLAEKLYRSGMPNTDDALKFLVSSVFCMLGTMWTDRISQASQMPRTHSARSKLVFEEFLTLVREHHNEERNVTYYADRLCFTPKYLSKLIKEVSGQSAPQWIDSFVILEAKNMLKYSDIPIKEIAQRLKFSSTAAFHTFFKAKTGLTPASYRG